MGLLMPFQQISLDMSLVKDLSYTLINHFKTKKHIIKS
jgi:hypothetical protein